MSDKASNAELSEGMNVSRRSALKSIGAAGIVGTAGIVTIPNIAAADFSCGYGGNVNWKKTYHGTDFGNSFPPYDTRLDHSVAVEYYGSTLNPSEVYLHEFRIFGQACGHAQKSSNDWKKTGFDITSIRQQDLIIDASEYTHYQALWDDESPCNIACDPKPDPVRADPDYSSVFTSASGYALSRIHPAIAAGLTAAQIVAALVNTKSPSFPHDRVHKTWNYSGSERAYDASYGLRFFIEQRDSCLRSQFILDSDVSSHACTVGGIGQKIILDAPTPPQYCGSQASTPSNTNKLLATLDDRYGVKKIPQAVIESRPVLKEFGNGEPLYKINLPVHTESIESE